MKYRAYILGLWALAAFALFVPCAIWNYCWHDWAPDDAPMAEKVTDDEAYYASEIVASTIRAAVSHRDDLLNGRAPEGTNARSAPGYNRSDFRRDVHTKSHGCVMANFEVAPDVPAQFRYGVFGAPKTPNAPNAIIRFSSGQPDIEPDKTPWSWLPFFGDVRGMAVKILGIEGPMLLDDHFYDQNQPYEKTQDFIATTSPVFFIRTIDQYSAFSAAFSRADLGKFRLMAYFLPHWWDPRGWHLHQFSLLEESLKRVPDSLVKETYYSGSAYRLGPTNYVKFRMRPCNANIQPMPPEKHEEGAQFDYLRLELKKQAEAGKACFNFEVQPQAIGKNMPVEDTTVEWSEKESPFQKIATITIYRQTNNTAEMNELCESLAFNPWHSVEDFKPVGVMNRLRKVVYHQMADFRRKKNCEASPAGCPAEPSTAGPTKQ